MKDWHRQRFKKAMGYDPDKPPKPRIEDIRKRIESQDRTKYPLRQLGLSADGPVYLSEEQRESHIHILGSPGQGKSKFLELLIRQDIKRGYGACLLDPSDNGDTMYKVLRWCIKEGFEKVCVIEPHDRRIAIPAIAPKHNLMETVRILFDTRSFSETPRIQKYLPAVFYALDKAEMTLAELVNFTDQKHPVYAHRRGKMLEALHPLDRRRIDLQEVFRTRHLFTSEFESTVRRMEPFLERTMTLMFGMREGIDFTKMITEGWLILCNLDYQGVTPDFSNEHQRLIGTTVINELFSAIGRLRARGWKGVYYLYIDEVGDYATRNLSTILDKKRKSGLRLTVAHQRFAQLEDRYVADAIMTGARIKVMFQTANADDRLKMVRMMYGGDLSDRMVSYVLSALARQQAVMKIEKGSPTTVRLRDVTDAQVSKQQVDEFKKKIYERDEWYHSPEEVLETINGRFTKTESAKPLTRSQSAPKKTSRLSRRNNNETTTQSTSEKPREGEDNRSSAPGAVPDDSPGSNPVLLSRKGRSTRKVIPDKPPA